MTRVHAALYALGAVYLGAYLVAVLFHLQGAVVPLGYGLIPAWFAGVCLAYWFDNKARGTR